MVLICEVPRWQVGLSGVRVHGAPGDLSVARSAAESAGLGASAAASPDATGALGLLASEREASRSRPASRLKGGLGGIVFGVRFFFFRIFRSIPFSDLQECLTNSTCGDGRSSTNASILGGSRLPECMEPWWWSTGWGLPLRFSARLRGLRDPKLWRLPRWSRWPRSWPGFWR